MSVRHSSSDHIINPCYVSGMSVKYPEVPTINGKEISNRRKNRDSYKENLSRRQMQAAPATPANKAIHYGPSCAGAGDGWKNSMSQRTVGQWRTPKYGFASRFSA